ncbi:MAG: preprotein translocase subunit SecG [Myxococcota bacterium]
MTTLLYIVHVIVCIGMLPIILLQSGKGGGVSAVFGGGGAGTVFGSRGASSFLTRMTTGCAVVFMLTSFGLSLQASRQRSVVEGIAPIPAAPAAGAAATGGETSDQASPPGEAQTGSSTASN